MYMPVIAIMGETITRPMEPTRMSKNLLNSRKRLRAKRNNQPAIPVVIKARLPGSGACADDSEWVWAYEKCARSSKKTATVLEIAPGDPVISI